MKRDIYEIKKMVKKYLFEKYNYLFIKVENRFIGCKYSEKEYFIFFISIFNEVLTLTYRENYQEKNVTRINIETFSDKQIEEYIDSIMAKAEGVRKSLNLPINKMSIIKENIMAGNETKSKVNASDYLSELEKIDQQFKANNNDAYKQYSNISIEKINMSYRLYNRLVINNIKNLEDILITPLTKFYKINYLGKKCIKELIKIKKECISNANIVCLDKRLINYKLSSLCISDEIKQVCENNHINNLYDLLISNYDEFEDIKGDYINLSYDEFLDKYLDLSIKPLSIGKLDINNFKNITGDDYEKYVDFGIRIGEIINEFLINEISPRASKIIKYRYCFINSDNYTLEEIGDKFNISRERVRQIINKFVRKIGCSKYKRLYLSQIIHLINEIDDKEIIKYYIYGIINIYNKVFLEFLLNLISMEYANQVFEHIKEITQLLKLEIINEKKTDNLIQKSIELIDLIKFPKATIDYSEYFSSLHKERNVNPENNVGTIHLMKQGKDVEYESFSEKKVLELLSYCPYISDIKVQSLAIEYEANDKKYLYFPDFQILFDDGRMAIIEVKDILSMADYLVKNKYNVLKEFCESKGIGYMMIDDRMSDFESIKSIKYNEENKKLLINHLVEHSRMKYEDFIKYKNETNFNNKEFLSMIINDDNIIFSRFPFYIKYICEKK